MEVPLTIMHVSVMVLFVLTMLVTVVGNVAVVVVFLKNRSLRTATNSFLVNVAIADILTGCVSIPLSIVTNTMPLTGPSAHAMEKVCLVSVSFTLMTIGASIAFLMLANLDRFVAIHAPFTYSRVFGVRTVVTLTSLSWGFFVVYSMTPLMGWHSPVTSETHCDIMMVLTPAQSVIVISVYTSIFLTLVTLNVKIYCTARRQSKCIRMLAGSIGESRSSQMAENDREAATASRKRSAISFGSHAVKASEVLPLQTWQSMPDLSHSTPLQASSLETSGSTEKASRKQKPAPGELRGNLKALKAVSTVVMAYTICHFPTATMLVVHLTARMTGLDTAKYHEPFLCVLAVTYLNSAMNPFIYYRVIPPFRYEVRRLTCFKEARYGRIIYSSSHPRRQRSSNLQIVSALLPDMTSPESKPRVTSSVSADPPLRTQVTFMQADETSWSSDTTTSPFRTQLMTSTSA